MGVRYQDLGFALMAGIVAIIMLPGKLKLIPLAGAAYLYLETTARR